jgi:UDP-N-acetylmuramoyl-tripeptide--D-alanyl-D-alanine ligase
MKKFSISVLAEIIKAYVEQDTSHEPRVTSHFLSGVSTDSRTTKPGDCFFAIQGENFDGHDYIAAAFAKGAVCAVVNEKSKIKNQKSKFGYCLLKVDDTIKALGDFARYYRRQCGFKVVAITGSVGKTITRQIAYHVLSQHYRVAQSPKNYNNNIGLPLTLLGTDPQDQIVIAELGTNHPGEIAYLTGIALPDVAVVTNVQPAHLEGFGSLEAISKEKLSIAESLKPDGVLIINADTVPRPTNARHRVVTFGRSADYDYQARNITLDGAKSSFSINDTQICLPVPGPGNVENALAAWAICSQFGLTATDFARAVETLTSVPMRAEVLQIGTLTMINDCYNANPASMKNALQILAGLDQAGKRRRVFICGYMAELGKYAEKLHAELGTHIAQARVQALLAVGKFANITAEAAKKAATYNLQAECFQDAFEVCNRLHEFVRDDDIILVKGSRAAKLETVTERLKGLSA